MDTKLLHTIARTQRLHPIFMFSTVNSANLKFSMDKFGVGRRSIYFTKDTKGMNNFEFTSWDFHALSKLVCKQETKTQHRSRDPSHLVFPASDPHTIYLGQLRCSPWLSCTGIPKPDQQRAPRSRTSGRGKS